MLVVAFDAEVEVVGVAGGGDAVSEQEVTTSAATDVVRASPRTTRIGNPR